MEYFGNHSYIRHHAKAFPSFVLDEAFGREEEKFNRTVRAAGRILLPHEINTISSHTVYKIKMLYKDHQWSSKHTLRYIETRTVLGGTFKPTSVRVHLMHANGYINILIPSMSSN